MRDVLAKCQLLVDLDEARVARVEELAERRQLAAGERLFELGSQADHVFVVLDGTVELCVPLSIHGAIREIVLASEGVGATLGWSAFVRPYRFRLSARASSAPASVATFERARLLRVIDEDPGFGCVFLSRIAEIISQRLRTVQALWARELQRTIAEGLQASPRR